MLNVVKRKEMADLLRYTLEFADLSFREAADLIGIDLDDFMLMVMGVIEIKPKVEKFIDEILGGK